MRIPRPTWGLAPPLPHRGGAIEALPPSNSENNGASANLQSALEGSCEFSGGLLRIFKRSG